MNNTEQEQLFQEKWELESGISLPDDFDGDKWKHRKLRKQFADFCREQKRKIFEQVDVGDACTVEITDANGEVLNLPIRTNVDWLALIAEHRESLNLPKFVPLERFIAYIQYVLSLQKDTHNFGNEVLSYDKFLRMLPSRTIAQAEKHGTPRIDTLIQNQGAYLAQGLIEIIANGIDASSLEKSIGRFGEGFFQSLKFLGNDGDEIMVETKSDNHPAWKIQLQKESGSIEIGTREAKKTISGTELSLKKPLDPETKTQLIDFVSRKLSTSTRAKIVVNGVFINDLSEYSYMNGGDIIQDDLPVVSIEINERGFTVVDEGCGMRSQEVSEKLLYPNNSDPNKKRYIPKEEELEGAIQGETKMFYSKRLNKIGKTNIRLQVAGVGIEEFEVTTSHGLQSFALELPSWTWLPESRNQIQPTKDVCLAIKVSMEKINTQAKSIEEKLALMEMLSKIITHLKPRQNEIKRDLKLENIAKENFQPLLKEIEASGLVALPADPDLINRIGNQEGAVYVSPAFVDLNPEQIPGIQRLTNIEDEKCPFYTIPFDVEAEHDYLILDDAVIVNQSRLDSSENIMLLNTAINLNVSYEIEEERVFYGRILSTNCEPIKRALGKTSENLSGGIEPVVLFLQKKDEAPVTEEVKFSEEEKSELEKKITNLAKEVGLVEEGLPDWLLERVVSVVCKRFQQADFIRGLAANGIKKEQLLHDTDLLKFLILTYRDDLERISFLLPLRHKFSEIINQYDVLEDFRIIISNLLDIQDTNVVYDCFERFLDTALEAPEFVKDIVAQTKDNNQINLLDFVIGKEQELRPVTPQVLFALAKNVKYESDYDDDAHLRNSVLAEIAKAFPEQAEQVLKGFNNLHDQYGRAIILAKIFPHEIIKILDEIPNKGDRSWVLVKIITEASEVDPLGALNLIKQNLEVLDDKDTFRISVVVASKLATDYFEQAKRILEAAIRRAGENTKDFITIAEIIQDSFPEESNKLCERVFSEIENSLETMDYIDPECHSMLETKINDLRRIIIIVANTNPGLAQEIGRIIFDIGGKLRDYEKPIPDLMEPLYSIIFYANPAAGTKIIDKIRSDSSLKQPDLDLFFLLNVARIHPEFFWEIIEKIDDKFNKMVIFSTIANMLAVENPEFSREVCNKILNSKYIRKPSDSGDFYVLFSLLNTMIKNKHKDASKLIRRLISINRSRKGDFPDEELKKLAITCACHNISIENRETGFWKKMRTRFWKSENKTINAVSIANMITNESENAFCDISLEIAKRDVEEALGLVEKITDTKDRSRAVIGIAKIIAETDHQRAFDMAFALPQEHRSTEVFIDLIIFIRKQQGTLEDDPAVQEQMYSLINPSQCINAFGKFLYHGGEFLKSEASQVDIVSEHSTTINLSDLMAMSRFASDDLGDAQTSQQLQKISAFLTDQGLGTELFQNEIASSIEGQDHSSMIWLREMVQNANDAIRRSGIKDPKIQIDFYANNGFWGTRIHDPVGMSFEEVNNKLLVIGESGKPGEDSVGMFGQGFYSLAVGAKEIRVKTSTGNGKTTLVKLTPILNEEGQVIDFQVHQQCTNEKFKGTTIERIDKQEGIMANMHALFGSQFLQKYVGNVSEVPIFHGKQEINPSNNVRTVSFLEVPGMGTLRISETKDRIERLTKDNLYISEIPQELLSDFPDWIIDIIRKRNITIDLPSKIPLTKSRNSITGFEENHAILRPYIYRGILQYVLHSYVNCGEIIPMLPEDYHSLDEYEGRRSYKITSCAKNINNSKSLSLKNANHLKDKAYMAELLTIIEFEHHGETLTLQKIKADIIQKKKVHSFESSRMMNVLATAHSFVEKASRAGRRKMISDKNAANILGVSLDRVQAFGQAISKGFFQIGKSTLGTDRIKNSFYERKGYSGLDRAMFNGIRNNTFWVNWNVGHFDSIASFDKKARDWESIIKTITHELTHGEERYDEFGSHQKDLEHDKSFERRQRKTLTKFIRQEEKAFPKFS